MKRLRCALVSLVFVLVSSACGGDDGVSCTTEFRYSVLLGVQDASTGTALAGVEIEYTIDGGPIRTLACDAACTLGGEEAGVFRITARKAGYRDAQQTVVVERDVCHVHTVTTTLALSRLP